MDPVKRIVLRLQLRKTEGTIVHHNALLAKAVKDTKMVSGYAICQNQACWHCWVEDSDGKKLDVTSGILSLPFEYASELPEGYKEMEHDQINENKRLYDLYVNDPHRFWKESPKTVREFK